MRVISLTGVRQPELTMRHAWYNPDQRVRTVCPGSLIHRAAAREDRHAASPQTKLLEWNTTSWRAMFNSSLAFTGFILSFWRDMTERKWKQVWWSTEQPILHCRFFFSLLLEGITTGRQRNPVININILSSHEYFSGCYAVRVCSFFKGSLSFFVEIAWMAPCVWLPSGAGSRRSGFQTPEREKGWGGRRDSQWWRVKACGLRIGQQECRLGRGYGGGNFKHNALIGAQT